jgi:hypothetical protein
MADEPKMIEATLGPYAGQRLTVTPADFDKAIADKWAIDPFKEQPAPAARLTPKGQEPKTEEPQPLPPTMTAEERDTAINAALDWQYDQLLEAAGPQPKEGESEEQRKAREERRDMIAGPGSAYVTRRGPGRPRKEPQPQ